MPSWLPALLVAAALVIMAAGGALAYRRWRTSRFERLPPGEVEEPDPLVPGLSPSWPEDEERDQDGKA